MKCWGGWKKGKAPLMKKTQCKDGKRIKGPNMKRSKRGQILTKDDKKSPSDLDMSLSVLLGVAQSSERIDLQQLLLCPLGVQLGQGMAGHLLSFPTASSSLASHLQPCPLLSTPHWPLERYSSTYSNLVQALTPSDTPHCPQDKFWIFIYNV